jgi:polyisoprenoid-binding protein YceI
MTCGVPSPAEDLGRALEVLADLPLGLGRAGVVHGRHRSRSGFGNLVTYGNRRNSHLVSGNDKESGLFPNPNEPRGGGGIDGNGDARGDRPERAAAPGDVDVRQDHTRLEFVARHMLSKVRGRFTEFDGTVTIAERPEDSHVEVEMQTASITTDTGMRDDHLRSDDFLEVDEYPTMSFRSTAAAPDRRDTFQLVGDLTIKGITREVVLDAEFNGWGPGASPRPSAARGRSRRRPRSTARTGT